MTLGGKSNMRMVCNSRTKRGLRWLAGVAVCSVACSSCRPSRLRSDSELGRSGTTNKLSVYSWPLPEPFAVTPADLVHGEKQVERMVHDRPHMQKYAGKNTELWRWCVRQYAGSSAGSRIFWNNEDPAPDSNGADSLRATHGRAAYIRLAKSTPRKAVGMDHTVIGEELWLGAVFELNNLSYSDKFEQVYTNGLMGKLTRDAWIRENTKIEYMAGQKTATVHAHLWNGLQSGDGPQASFYGPNYPSNYDAFVQLYSDRSSYPWSSWGKYYDEQIAPAARVNLSYR